MLKSLFSIFSLSNFISSQSHSRESRSTLPYFNFYPKNDVVTSQYIGFPFFPPDFNLFPIYLTIPCCRTAPQPPTHVVNRLESFSENRHQFPLTLVCGCQIADIWRENFFHGVLRKFARIRKNVQGVPKKNWLIECFWNRGAQAKISSHPHGGCDKYKTLPKALRTQALTTLTSNFDLVG